MKYAIIETGGKQYKVEDQKFIDIEKINSLKEGQSIVFDKILMIANDDESIEIGTPYLKDKTIKGTLLEEFRDKKVRVIKFKPKSRYKKNKGHRQEKMRVKFTFK